MRGEHAGHTLQTTALVNEAYIRLVDSSRVQWQNRAHFFAIAAQLMRRILVDFARHRRYQKRGGDWRRVTLAEGLDVRGKRESPISWLWTRRFRHCPSSTLAKRKSSSCGFSAD